MRLVAATHRNPAEMAKCGQFRQDLLYRISEFTLRIPSLRERREDIGPIALALLNREGHARSLSADAIAYLQELAWPGNVRELRNVMRRAAALATDLIIDRQLLQSLEEVTAEIELPPGFRSGLPAEFASLAPRTSWSAIGESIPSIPGSSLRSRLLQPPPTVSLSDPGGLKSRGDSSRQDFDLTFADATEAFRKAYVRELKRRFGDDVNAAAAHAGVHPKSVSRLYRMYRIA
jgi:DNA-binding NtrC family response regulator